MIHAQNMKVANILPPISLAGAATATVTEVDAIGFDYMVVLISSGLVGGTGVATMKLQESDTTGTGYVDITGAALTALVDADDNKQYAIFVDLRYRKRFFNLVITNGATNASVMAAVAVLSRAEQAPSTAALRGLAEQKFV